MTRRWLACGVAGLATLGLAGPTSLLAVDHQQPSAASVATPERALITQYCSGCHSDRTKAGGLSLGSIDLQNVSASAEVWEKAVRKLRARAMPPAGAPRPDEAGYARLVTFLESSLDRAARAKPDPGRTDPFRRLNRTEYRNAIRDLLGLDVDVNDLLPNDDASHGFDNVSVVGLSPTLMERYLTAAQRISRLAVGSPVRRPSSRTVVLPPDFTQESHVDGLPLGTRGGVAVDHAFPVDGDYRIQVQLARDRNENVEGLTEPHELEIALDGRRLKTFTIAPNRNRSGSYYADEGVDKGLEVRLPIDAGPHVVTVTFLQNNSALIETERQPYQAHFNMDRHPRVQPAVRTVSIEGPFDMTGAGESPSRQRIFTCTPSAERGSPAAAEERCARSIIRTLARRAYRRPVTDKDIEAPLAFYKEARSSKTDGASFEAGIEMALRALLASTEFLFRIERDPAGAASGAAYHVDDIAIASRLSFFLWSSAPDDELLGLAERGQLREPTILERQVRRMIADPRASALATNFANQWFYLRNLPVASPDARMFPDFDDNLRQSFRRETELLFQSVVDEDRPVTDLLDADYTFLNERLARHYRIGGVYGDRFRRVGLAGHPERRGLLGQGSILTVTSYATRTSPVLRGKWILDNLLGMPPPPPPPDVPALKENKPGGQALSMRQRMAEHRTNPTCASCHQLMDPAGLSLENFDAIGRWRVQDESGSAIDASGGLPGGTAFDGVAGLRGALTERPELFASTATEKLLTFALGRGVDDRDRPAVREILREASPDGYRFSSLVVGIVKSVPFQMRLAN